MSSSFKAMSILICLCILVSCNRQSTTRQISFDTSFTAPSDWKLVEEGLWGLRFSVPPTVRNTENKSLWIHEGPKIRFIVDFDHYPSQDSLKRKPHYLEQRLLVNGLPALVCSYDQPRDASGGSLNRVVALVFLEKRKELGAGHEPWFRVEYSSDDDRATALQILQTVQFYDS